MKNLKIISIGLVLFCFSQTLKAQTDMGNILIGGGTNMSLSFMNSKWKTDDNNGDAGKSTNLEITPQIGYFVSDGLAFGVELPISYNHEEDEFHDKYNSTSLAFVPFLRYYFGSDIIKPYVHGGLGFGTLNMKYEPDFGSTETMSAGMFLFEIGGGLNYFIKDNVALDFGLGYAYASAKPNENNNVNYRNISNGLGIEIGIAVMLD
ncbi:MAG: outer membrane protein [Salinivirgaceae bacterium]